MRYSEMLNLATQYDKSLVAEDPRFTLTVEVKHEDSSYFKWKNAFLMEKDDWIFVFTEHFGFHLFHKEDLVSYRNYNKNSIFIEEVDIERFPL